MTPQETWVEKNQQYLVHNIKQIEMLIRKFIERTDTKKDNGLMEESSNKPEKNESVAAMERKYTARPQPQESVSEEEGKILYDPALEDDHNPPAIESLCKIFGLTSFERSTLLLCAGVELKTEFADLCARAHQDPNSSYPTFGLALAALPAAHWSALTPISPLRRFRLITLRDYQHTSITKCPIKIEERVLHYLTGISYVDRSLWGMLIRPGKFGFTLSTLQQEIVKQILMAPQENNNMITNNNYTKSTVLRHFSNALEPSLTKNATCIYLWGSDKTAKEIIASRVCSDLGLDLWHVSAEFMPSKPEDIEAFSCLWCREASLLGCSLFISAEEVLDPTARNVISQLVTSGVLPRPLFLSTRERWESLGQTQTTTFEVNRPSKLEQLQIWNEYMKEALSTPKTTATKTTDTNTNFNGKAYSNNDTEIINTDELSRKLAYQFDFNTIAIVSAVSETLSNLEYKSSSISASSFESCIWRTCRRLANTDMGGLASKIDAKAKLEDLVLPDIQKQLLYTISTHVKHKGKVYKEWGFENKSNRGLAITALFAGESGTGKTMAAEALADLLDLDLYKIDLSTVVSKYIGETEKNLRRVFDAADSGGAILFFDEADALFGKRSEVKDSHDRHANIEVGYLLQKMEEFDGLAILATNMKNALDTAFTRRIRFIVKFPFPDEASRAEIWTRVFPTTTPKNNLDIASLAKLNITGGSIRNIALNASFIAANQGVKLNMQHLKEATKMEYDKLERSLPKSELGW
jgi:AAA+ superfamily predicted ATPase